MTDTQLALALDDGGPASTKDLESFKGFDVGASHPGDGPLAWSSPTGWSYLTGLLGMDTADPFPRSISTSDAVRTTAFLACCDIVAQDTARAALTLRKRLPGGGSVRVQPREHPLAKLFWTKPTGTMTWNEWVHMMMFHLSAVNNAYFWPRSKDGATFSELIPLLPGWVIQQVTSVLPRRVMYLVQGYSLYDVVRLGTDKQVILFEEEICHVKTRYIGGGGGMSSMMLGNRVLSLLNTLQRFQQKLYNREGQPRGVFQQAPNQEPLNQEQYDRLVDSLKRALGEVSRDPSRPLVLESGLTFEKVGLSSQELQHKELWNDTLSEVARLMRIPPHKFWHLTSIKYENQATLERNYVRDSLIPRAQAFEERANLILLSEDEQLDYYVEFDRDQLYQADIESLTKLTLDKWRAGLILRNEALNILGHNPNGPAGEVYQMPANTYLLDQNNAVVVAPGGGAAATNDPPADAPPPPKAVDEDEEE